MLSEFAAPTLEYHVDHAPQIVSMAITSRCNLRCVMCDHIFGKVEKQDFDPSLIEQIGDFIGRAKIVDMTGLGEPLFSSLFWKILDRFPRDAAKDPMLMFNTNGVLLTEANNERILAARTRRIRVSIDSPDPDMFFGIRGVSLATVVGGLERLVQRRNALGLTAPMIGVEMTIMRRNLHQMRDMIDLVKRIGADFVEFWQINEITGATLDNWKVEARGSAFVYSEELLSGAPREEVQSAIHDATDYAEGLGLGAAFIALGTGVGTTMYPHNIAKVEVNWSEESIRCNLPWQELRSEYSGKVTACCWGPKPVGDLAKETMAEIWNGRAIREMRRDLVAGRVPRLCDGAPCPILQERKRAACERAEVASAGAS